MGSLVALLALLLTIALWLAEYSIGVLGSNLTIGNIFIMYIQVCPHRACMGFFQFPSTFQKQVIWLRIKYMSH